MKNQCILFLKKVYITKMLNYKIYSSYPFFKNSVKYVWIDKRMFFFDIILAGAFPYIIQFLLWGNSFGDSKLHHGYSYFSLMCYYVYVISINRLNNGYDIIDSLSTIISNGNLDMHKCKPISFLHQRFLIFLGTSVPYFVLFYILHITVNILLFVNFKTLIFNLLLAIPVILISHLLCFYISILFGLFTFITLKPNFILSLLLFQQTFLGGVVLPYDFWPKWLSPLMHYNPFWFVIAGPASLLLNQSINGLLIYFTGAILYIILLYFIVRILLNKMSIHMHNIGG